MRTLLKQAHSTFSEGGGMNTAAHPKTRHKCLTLRTNCHQDHHLRDFRPCMNTRNENLARSNKLGRTFAVLDIAESHKSR
jgi:hypothetical protein